MSRVMTVCAFAAVVPAASAPASAIYERLLLMTNSMRTGKLDLTAGHKISTPVFGLCSCDRATAEPVFHRRKVGAFTPYGNHTLAAAPVEAALTAAARGAP